MKMRYTDIIFDVDGTLIDTEKTGVLSFLQTVKELMGEEWSYERGYTVFGIPSSKVADFIGYPDGRLFEEVWERHFIEMRHLASPFPGMEDILKAAKSAGLRTGIVSSRSRKEYDLDWQFAPYTHYFDYVVLADATERHKPFPDPIYKYIEMASEGLVEKISPSDCIYLGDTDHDSGCAHAAGCDFALADWRKRGMQGISAEYHFTDAQEAIEIILQ